MTFTRTDALRLIGLYILAYLAVVALAIAVTRSFALPINDDVAIAMHTALAVLVLLAQRHTISATMAGGLGPWRWWGAVAFGLLLVALTVGLAVGILLMFTLPGAPLETWWNSAQATADFDAVIERLERPLLDPGAWPERGYLIAASIALGLLLNWPIGNLLATRTGRPATGYIVVAALLGTSDTTLFDAAQSYAPALFLERPIWAPYAAACAAAVIVATVNASLVSLTLFAMSDRKPDAGRTARNENEIAGGDTTTTDADAEPDDRAAS